MPILIGELSQPGGQASVVGSRFEIRRKLGAGAMGAVYRAFDRKQRSEVALKMLLQTSGRELYRFKREFRTLADVGHPNLVNLYELHTAGREWFFTMELVDGESFRTYVRPGDSSTSPQDDDRTPAPVDETMQTGVVPGPRTASRAAGGTLDLERLESAFYQLVDGVLALHYTNCLHRDLKPSNVLVDASGRVVLLDFGLAGDKQRLELDVTHEHAAVGTPMYMSPEQAADVPLDEASDWYSVGVMLYEALTGLRPYQRRLLQQSILLLKQTEDPQPVATLNPQAPAHLAALCDRLLARDPRARPTGEEILAQLERSPSAATVKLRSSGDDQGFVGRAYELAALQAAFQDSRHGVVCVHVRGAAGMGKSLLVRRFLDSVPSRDRAVVLRGRCYQREAVPHKALDELVDSVSRHLSSLSPRQVNDLLPVDVMCLSRLFPVLERVPAVAEPEIRGFAPSNVQELRRRGLTALLELLAAIAKEQPLILHIDDLQWGDIDSVGFLVEVLESSIAPRLLLLLSSRIEGAEDNPMLTALAEATGEVSRHRLRELLLERLNLEETAQLIAAATGIEPSADQVARLAADTEGNPLFIAELARSARAGGASLDELITERIAELSDEERALLAVCAVAVQPIPFELASRAAGLESEPGIAHALRAARLLRVREGTRETFLEPYHDRVRQAAVTALDRDTARVHRDLALAYEERDDESRSEALVEHWLGAGDAAKVAQHAHEAAIAAVRSCTFHRAANYYRLVLDHTATGEEETRALLTQLAEALTNAGRLDEAADAYGRAEEHATGDTRLELQRKRVSAQLRRGHLDTSMESVRELLASINVSLPRGSRSAIAAIALNRARLKLRGYRAVVSETQPEPEVLRRLETLWSLCTAFGHLEPLRGHALVGRFVREALDSGHAPSIVRALASECAFASLPGERGHARSQTLYRQARALAQDSDDPRLIGQTEMGYGIALTLIGRWSKALNYLHTGERLLEENSASVRWETDFCQVLRAANLAYLGHIRELQRLVPKWLREARERGDVYAVRGIEGTRGNLVWLAADDPAEAQLRIERVRTRRGTTLHTHNFYELLAERNIEIYRGHGGRACDVLEEQWRSIASGQVSSIQLARIEAWQLRGRAAAARHDDGPDPAVLAVLDKCVRRLQGEGTRLSGAWAEALRAASSRARGNDQATHDALERAVAGFENLGMTVYDACARHQLGVLVGGDAGESGRERALADLRSEDVADPMAFIRLHLPGFG